MTDAELADSLGNRFLRRSIRINSGVTFTIQGNLCFEDIRIFTIGHILLPMSDFAKEAGVPDFYWDLGYSVFSVSEKELLLIGPYRVQTGDDYSPWVHTLRVFTHVSDAEVELWKAYYDQ